MRRLGIGVLASVLTAACSDDGAPADEATLSTTDNGGTVDDGGTATAPTATATDTNPTTDTDSAGGTGSSGADGSTGPTTASAGTDDTGPAGDECVTDEDCMVVDDCCSCTAIAVDAEPPACDLPECLQSTCSALGIQAVAQCELGSCELAPVACDPTVVSCESVPPECEPGFLPGTNPKTSCWTGLCVPVEVCDVVPSCADCPEDETCVEYATEPDPQYHCSPIPEACDGVPSCECLADACVSPLDTCGDGANGVTCS